MSFVQEKKIVFVYYNPTRKITNFTFHKYNYVLSSDPISRKTTHVESTEKKPNLKVGKSVIVVVIYNYVLCLSFNNLNVHSNKIPFD